MGEFKTAADHSTTRLGYGDLNGTHGVSDSSAASGTVENASLQASRIPGGIVDGDINVSHSSGGLETAAFPDLTCENTRHKVWMEIKQLTHQWFASWSSGVITKNRPQLKGLLEFFMQRLQHMHNEVEECGMGRLCVTLLAISSGEAGSSFKSAPALHSPLLTVLLDVPWLIIMRSGWPLFGLLAQIHLQHHREADMPTTGVTADYYHALHAGLAQQKSELLAEMGVEFVRHQEMKEGMIPTYVMPALCALASQLLSPQLLTDEVRFDEALRYMQGFFHQAVNNIDDMQTTIDSVWPLYGLLHAASLEFAPLAKTS